MADLLNTLALIAATFTGFIGIVFVLGRRAEGSLSIHESSAVFHLLYTALGALFISLVASVFLALIDKEALVWQVGNGVCGLYLLIGVGIATVAEFQGRFGIPRKGIVWPIFVGSYVLVGVAFAVAAGYFSAAAAIVFMMCIIWLLLVTTTYFVSLVALLPTGKLND